MSSKHMWKCPKCGREFARKGQWHSHASSSVDNMFVGKPPKLKKIFDSILRELQRDGPIIRVDAVKSSINLAGKSHFGGIRVLKDSLNIGFILKRRVENPHVTKIQDLGHNTFAHIVNVRELGDVDKELLGWLKEAYSLRKSQEASQSPKEKL